jgi:hypothetical protein
MMNLFINSIDYSTRLLEALDLPIVYNLNTGDNTLEIRSTKPIAKLYWAIDSDHDGDLSLSYFNGTSFSTLSFTSDSTNELTSQGWLTWDRASNDSKDGDLYKYRFTLESVSASKVATIKFVGVIFSEDRDLKKEYPNIVDHKPENDSSFLRFHVSSKDSIVQWFRGKGELTYNGVKFKEVDEFDFFEPSQLNMASRFMTLAKIFFWLSDSVDDKYYQKGKDFMAEAYNSLDVYYISIDKDGDAIPDEVSDFEDTITVLKRG